MNKKGKNIFISILSALNVKHTEYYTNKFFNEHPHKYNLYGISKMLSDYGISNVATKIENKESDIHEIQLPFVAHSGGDFVLVYSIEKQYVNFRQKDLNISVEINEFCKSWSGIILLAEASSTSIEPNYKNNYREKLITRFLKITLIVCLSLFLCYELLTRNNLGEISLIIPIIVNMIGLAVTFLIIQKQLNIKSSYADKICSLFDQNDCNSILDSKASKLWNTFSWSEIGLAYFISNILIITFYPSLISVYSLFNILILPYTIWSIWYQKLIAKQWCSLCVIVQITLWTIFFTNLIFNFLTFPPQIYSLLDLMASILLYSITFLFTTQLIPYFSQSVKIENIKQEINSLKLNQDVLELLLKKQPHYELKKSDSQVIIGNPDSKILVTILTNPHCNPCAIMHERIGNLLKLNNDNLCFQFIFTSFNEHLETSSKFLISSYLDNKNDSNEIFQLWYNEGKNNREKFFKKYPFNFDSIEVQQELDKHKNWKSITKLELTPTILINGYKLPENYQIEDLRYFSELNI